MFDLSSLFFSCRRAKFRLTILRIFAESANRAGVEREDAVKRAKDLELQLETLRKESQAALKQAQDEAKKQEDKNRAQAAKHEERLAARLRPVVDALSSK